MSCVITVKGDGQGRYGHPKNDRTGPLEEFMVDNVVFYTAVFKHLKSCDGHDPNKILKYYLSRRIKRGDQMITGTLVKLALKYARHFVIDPAILNEYKWRSGINDWDYRKDLSLHDLARAVKIQVSTGYLNTLFGAMDKAPDRKVLTALYNIVQGMETEEVLNMEETEELSKLIEVVDVMVT